MTTFGVGIPREQEHPDNGVSILSVLLVGVLVVGCLVVGGGLLFIRTLNRHPYVGKGDPGNRRLHELATDPIFHMVPPGARSAGIALTPARYRLTPFEGAGAVWDGPSVVLTFSSSNSLRTVYGLVAEEAKANGWRPIDMSRFGSPESWYKTYPNGASASLGLLWLGPLYPPPGPIKYQLSGSISLPGESWSGLFAHATPVEPPPRAQPDPGNQRLNQLAGDPVFHGKAPGASSRKLALLPARLVGGGAAEPPSVTLTFESSASPLSVLEYYGRQAAAHAWLFTSVGALHVPDIWHKTYANGAEATLLVTWMPPAADQSRPIHYIVAGNISVAGEILRFALPSGVGAHPSGVVDSPGQLRRRRPTSGPVTSSASATSRSATSDRL